MPTPPQALGIVIRHVIWQHNAQTIGWRSGGLSISEMATIRSEPTPPHSTVSAVYTAKLIKSVCGLQDSNVSRDYELRVLPPAPETDTLREMGIDACHFSGS